MKTRERHRLKGSVPKAESPGSEASERDIAEYRWIFKSYRFGRW